MLPCWHGRQTNQTLKITFSDIVVLTPKSQDTKSGKASRFFVDKFVRKLNQHSNHPFFALRDKIKQIRPSFVFVRADSNPATQREEWLKERVGRYPLH
jgi:hypothetical protein